MTSSERFERFRRFLADRVTESINTGHPVSARNTEYRCPLGCLPFIGGGRPRAWMAASQILTEREATRFIRAFDYGDGRGKHARLGRLYRARFP